jgi:hypothetical protein
MTFRLPMPASGSSYPAPTRQAMSFDVSLVAFAALNVRMP